MTSPHDGAHTQGNPGGRTAAGVPPRGAVASAPRGESDPAVPAAPTLHGLEDAVHRIEAEAEHRPPPAGVTTNVIVAAVVIVFGVTALLLSASLGAGSANNPGPGTWPTLISIAIVLLGLALAAVARRTSDAERFSRSSWLVVAGLATMVAFVAVIGIIGFEIPAALLTFVWLRFLGGESWRMSIILSLGVVVAFYLVFVAALSVPIPHLF